MLPEGTIFSGRQWVDALILEVVGLLDVTLHFVGYVSCAEFILHFPIIYRWIYGIYPVSAGSMR